MSYYKTKIALRAIIILVLIFIAAPSVLIRAQNCVQPAPNLVSWWKADGDALDVYSRNNGTLLGNANTVPGFNGKAFYLTETTDAVGLGSNPPTFEMTSMTFEAWIYRTGNVQPGALQDIFADWFGDAAQDSYLLAIYNDNGMVRLFGAIGDGATGDSGFSGGTINSNTWTHVAMTYNASDGSNKLYVNGAEVASRTRPNGIFNGDNYVYLGRESPNLDRYYKGLLDEPAVYSRALSAAEIQSIYSAAQAGKCKPLGIFSQGQKLGEPFNPTNSFYGTSTAIDGDLMVVGMPGRDTIDGRSGSATVYAKVNGLWEAQVSVLPPGADNAGDSFGYSVAISGDLLVVGSIYDDELASNAGAVYVYARESGGWVFKQKIKATDGAASDEFGKSVATNGNTIVVGAHGADQGSEADAGAVYVFTKNNFGVWAQQHKFIPTNAPFATDLLGTSVAINGDTIAAGAIYDRDKAGNRWGSVYVYARNGGTWLQQERLSLVGIGGYGLADFGTSVAIDGNRLVVGAPGQAANANKGFAYVFVRNGTSWSYERTLEATDGENLDFFGTSVAIKGDTIAVGAPFDDTFGGPDTGAAYTFTRTGTTWTQRQKLTSSEYTPGANFGWSVSLSGDRKTLAVGAHRYSNNNGAVFSFNQQPKIGAPFDFDGDGKTDISIFRPSNGQWWYYRSSDGGNYAATFGNSSDKLTPGDFTGDGRADIALFRPSSGEWFILRSEDGTYYSYPFGTSNDIPAVGDFDADGKADSAVFRPSDTTWYIRRSSDGGFTIQQFGASGDVPATADYDGDGRTDIAIYRPSNGQWWLNRSTAGVIVFTFGNSADKLVQGDYTGDGKADVAIWRPSSGEWFILRSEDQSYYSFPFGTSGDMPAPGDFDGDGRFDAAVFRPSSSTWYVQRTTAGTLIQSFGTGGDKPVPAAFIP